MNELQNFLLNISISDEAMEDLEMFNKKYNEKIKNFCIDFNNNNENNENNFIKLNLFNNNKIGNFSVKNYIKNILNLLNKKQLFYLINNLSKNLDININIITLIKSITKKTKKNIIILRLTEIFLIILKKQ
jgi:hypothetical protein